jgi:ketosteroid isomerase-like protein
MPTTLPTAKGADMQDAYQQIFDTIRLDVTFTIDELEITGDHTAYALTRADGSLRRFDPLTGEPVGVAPTVADQWRDGRWRCRTRTPEAPTAVSGRRSSDDRRSASR